MTSERRAIERLRDIIAYAKAARIAVGEYARDVIANDALRRDALYYDMLIVSEVTARLLDIEPNLTARYPHIPWTSIRAVGNVLRHGYRGIELDIVYDAVSSVRWQSCSQ